LHLKDSTENYQLVLNILRVT